MSLLSLHWPGACSVRPDRVQACFSSSLESNNGHCHSILSHLLLFKQQYSHDKTDVYRAAIINSNRESVVSCHRFLKPSKLGVIRITHHQTSHQWQCFTNVLLWVRKLSDTARPCNVTTLICYPAQNAQPARNNAAIHKINHKWENSNIMCHKRRVLKQSYS